MKSIRREDFREAGTLAKVHGPKGELRFLPDYQLTLKEWVFLSIKGKPVPFFIESVKGSDDAPIIKLRYIEDTFEAEKFVKAGLHPKNMMLGTSGHTEMNSATSMDLAHSDTELSPLMNVV